MPNPVVHFEIVSSDVEKSQSFFKELFDWHIEAMPMGDMPGMVYGMVDTHSEGISGGIGSSPDGQTHVTFYIEVDDLQAYLDKAEALGGKTVMPVTEIPGYVTLAMFSDPAGAVVGLVKSDQQ